MKYMEQELIAIPFGSSKVDALYYKSKKNVSEEISKTAVIHVHGFLGNFLDGTQRFLPPILAKSGYSSLSINTRLANFGLFFGYGIIDDTIPQIDRSIEFLLEQGFKNIIVSGYSLGGAVALRYMAMRNSKSKYPHIKGVIVLAAPYSMPDSIKRRWDKWGSEPSYDQIYKEAEEIFKGDPDNTDEDRTIVIYKTRGDSYIPEHSGIYTYKTWWHLASPHAESGKCYKQIEKIKLPILLVQGWYDEIVGSQETYHLAQVARDAGNKSVSVFFVDSGHAFEEHEKELGDIAVGWLNSKFEE
ncbi:MAG: alpha/beta hydrolase [Candidatus Dadabacteria bacterium]|nr:alpha/beta hydrolase [Candidatus Dadabacteria bacterium]NIV41419.1 prolyl oligopeptidase family serine peptidase [Candidatus Dadabacteria bacterium]